MFDLSLVGNATERTSYRYRWEDSVTYALGIGAKADEIDYLFEQRGPRVFPLQALAPGLDPVVRLLDRCSPKGARRMHSAQVLEVRADVPPAGEIEIEARLVGIFDHEKFATVVADTVSKVAGTSNVLVEGKWTFLFPGKGGFGGPKPVRQERPNVGDRPPDESVQDASLREQAFLYRLGGDLNPIHVDPEAARRVGLENPILQGLCTFGFMFRALSKRGRIASLSGQFRRPAFPGDVFITDRWKVDDNVSVVSLRAQGRDEPLIGEGTVRYA